MIELRFESLLAASPQEVWSRVSTMQGVNAELTPILRRFITTVFDHRHRVLRRTFGTPA